jgi:hypothetical protein
MRWSELLLLGALVALGITVRPQLALNDALALLPVLWAIRRRPIAVVALAVGLAVPIGAVIAINSDAAGKFTLLSENTGINFFLAQCGAGRVEVHGPHVVYYIESPVYTQRHSGRFYVFQGHDVWDQGFFVSQAMACIRADGIGHFSVIGRHILDLTVTSVPWPQNDDPAMRGIARVTNVGYSVLLPTILITGIIIFWRRRPESRGPRLVLAHLLCVLPKVIFFVSEPRYRIPYDVFGLAFLAALIVRSLEARRSAPVDGPAHELREP